MYFFLSIDSDLLFSDPGYYASPYKLKDSSDDLLNSLLDFQTQGLDGTKNEEVSKKQNEEVSKKKSSLKKKIGADSKNSKKDVFIF